jgi:hypothetical protein
VLRSIAAMATNTCQIVVGKLLEVRVAAGVQTIADVDGLSALFRAAIAGVPGAGRVVIAGDWRGCRLIMPETAERVHGMLTAANPRVERSALLHASDSPTVLLQLFRLVRESHHTERRVFTSARPAEKWLGERLTAEERTRLGAFLRSGG